MKMIRLNGSALSRLLIILALASATGGCQGGHSSAGHEQQGCRPDAAEVVTMAPPALYQMMTSCIRADDMDSAVYLYALAGSRSTSDAERVGTQYAYSMHNTVLRNALKKIDRVQNKRFWGVVQSTLAEPEKKARICRKLKAQPAPSYAPAYMQLEKSAGLAADQTQWQDAVDRYLECP